MRAYSENLREKIVAAIERGMPKAQAARTFDVNLSSVKRYAKRWPVGESHPIEEAFSKIKDLLREAEARSRKPLLEAIGAALWALSSQDARGFFEHCGYRAAVQLLW